MGGSNGELQDLTNRLVDRATAYGMEISTENRKIMTNSTNNISVEISTENRKFLTNSTNNISADISMNGPKLEKVTSLKYLGAALCKDGSCSADVRIRIASAMAAMARLNRIWP